MKSKAPSLILAGVLVAGLAAVTLARSPDGGAAGRTDDKGEHRGRHRRPPLHQVATQHAQELGISADTIARMKALEDAAQPQLSQLKANTKKAREAVRAGGDRAQLETAHQALRARHQALRAEVTALLTEQQRTKLRELKGHRGHKRSFKPAQ